MGLLRGTLNGTAADFETAWCHHVFFLRVFASARRTKLETVDCAKNAGRGDAWGEGELDGEAGGGMREGGALEES